ncbi:MAG: DUF190 domain-containing protein [Thiobacillaceae bacterium]
MNMICLQCFVSEAERHHGKLAYEWLLDLAREHGFAGGTAFRALAGFGRHGQHHDAGFFELAGSLPVVVEFFVDDAAADQYLALIGQAGLKLVYAKLPVETGVTG